MITIGIFGPPDDQEVAALAERLRSRGAQPWIVDPTRMRLAWSADGLTVDGRSPLEMSAAYLRRVGTRLSGALRYDQPPPALDAAGWAALLPASLAALRAERRALVVRTAVIRAVARQRPVVNPPDEQNLHRLKTLLLGRLRRAGLPVPELAAGTDARRLGAWAAAAPTVDKPVAGIYKTHLWSRRRHDDRPWASRPALYQRYVRGDTVRCYVLAGEVLTAGRIVTTGEHVDSSIAQTGVEVLEVTPRMREVAVGAARAVGLAFCGLDLLLERGSRHVSLIDCNLSPMFVNHGIMSRCDIAGHLAEHLIELGARGGDYRRPRVLDMVDEAKQLLAGDPELVRLLQGRGGGGERNDG